MEIWIKLILMWAMGFYTAYNIFTKQKSAPCLKPESKE